MVRDAFINYTNPAEIKGRNSKRKVASYIGVHFRNRSRPSATAAAAKQLLPRQSGICRHPPKRLLLLAGPAPDADEETERSPANEYFTATLQLLRDGHGTRSDPFSAWPIEFQPSIPSAIDYFIQFYAPTHAIRPEIYTPKGGHEVVQDYFQYALQHPLMFEAIVALSRANLTVSAWSDHRPDSQTLYHYGSAVARLRELIASQDTHAATEDSVLFAIVALMGIDFLKNDMLAFQAHLAGLRHLVKLRGGLDALGWPTLLEPSIKGLETFWTYICSTPHLLPPNMITTVPSQPFLARNPPATKGPCLPPLTEQIASLPKGFRRLAESGRLSPIVISLLFQANRFDIHLHHHPGHKHLTRYGSPIRASHAAFTSRRGTPTHNASNLSLTELTAAVLVEKSLTRLERLVCLSLLTVLMGCTRTEKLAKLVAAQMRLCVVEALAFPLRADDPIERDFVAWVSLILGAGSGIDEGADIDDMWGGHGCGSHDPWFKGWKGDPRLTAVRRVVEHFRGWRSLEEVQSEIVQGFIWTDYCAETISENWRRMEYVLKKEEQDAHDGIHVNVAS